MTAITALKNKNETDTRSLSSTASDLDQDHQYFQVKYEGIYIDFIPYKSTNSLKLIPIAISSYDQIPDKVVGKIEIKDYKTNTNTVIYRSFKKKYIKIKNANK